jgi:hypothetical protein
MSRRFQVFGGVIEIPRKKKRQRKLSGSFSIKQKKIIIFFILANTSTYFESHVFSRIRQVI